MVEAKATADSSKEGCSVSITIEGHGKEILEETLALIQGVMGSLKESSFALHLMAVKAIADNPEVLLGEDETVVKDFEKFVATHNFRGGIN